MVREEYITPRSVPTDVPRLVRLAQAGFISGRILETVDVRIYRLSGRRLDLSFSVSDNVFHLRTRAAQECGGVDPRQLKLSCRQRGLQLPVGEPHRLVDLLSHPFPSSNLLELNLHVLSDQLVIEGEEDPL